MLYYMGKCIFWVYFSIFYRVKIEGSEKVPKSGGLILCSNHIHWLDPLLLSSYIKRKINYMGKAELFENKFFAIILKGINVFPVKRGTGDISAIKSALKLIKSEKALGMFPEGTRSRDGQIGQAEPGVALLAVKTNAFVIPIRIHGSYKIFSSLKIIIGDAMKFSDYNNVKLSSEDINRLSQSVMEQIRQLK